MHNYLTEPDQFIYLQTHLRSSLRVSPKLQTAMKVQIYETLPECDS